MFCAAMQASGHPLHLTFTNLEFKTQNSRWEITIKVFSDDFASNLKMTTGTDLPINNKSKGEDVETILGAWLGNRFCIWFDSRPIEFNAWKFGGVKIKEDATWLTYSFNAPLPVSEIKIKNTLLLDLYSDQKNLFILVMGQTQSAFEFKNKNQETIIKLNK
jgi:hypothetical protein